MKRSAGILLFKKSSDGYAVLLVHPGGPFWAKKDIGVWSIPKGEFQDHEEPIAAAKREFGEEMGRPVPEGNFIDLGSAKQSSSKEVFAWALQADFDAEAIESNKITIEWPPKSGKAMEIPEIDKAGWFAIDDAATKIVKGQWPFLERLAEYLRINIPVSNQRTPEFEKIKFTQTPLF